MPSAPAPSAVARSGWTRKNPFTSEVAVNRLLSGPGSDKEIRHYEFALADSGIEYEAGDALAIIPENDPALVGEIAEHFRMSVDIFVVASYSASCLATATRSARPRRICSARWRAARTPPMTPTPTRLRVPATR